MPTIRANGLEVNYTIDVPDTGIIDGPNTGHTVMLSHSLGADLSMWDGQVSELVAAGYRVLRYDTRGHGKSAAPEGPYAMEFLAEDALGLMDALGLEKVHFCGLSMGGMVGQLLAVRRQERLSSLMLCSTSPFTGNAQMWNRRIATVEREGMEALADATIERWFTAEGRKKMPEQVERIRGSILSTPPHGYAACSAAIRDMDLREPIREITVPTLVLVGEGDQGTPVSVARSIHERIAGSSLTVIPNAAHLINVEQEERFNKEILGFLQQAAM